MECEEDDLAPWQHSPKAGEGPGKKMVGSEQPSADPEQQTIILTLVPVSPAAQPLVQAQTHRSPDAVPTSLSSTYQNQNPLSRPLVLMPVSTSSQLTQLSAPLTNSSCSSPSGQPIILSAQSLLGASTDQTSQQGLILNGQPITILPRGQGTPILPLPSAKVGLAGSGSTVHIPVTLTIRSSTGIQTISNVASGSINLNSTTTSSTALPSTSPIITEVVSVGASDSADGHAVHSPPPHPALASSSSSRSPLVSQGKGLPPGPLKGFLTPTKPKTCKHCGFRYKTINALRGYLCMCSVEVAWSLKKISTSSKPFQKSSKRPRSSRDSSSSSDSSSDSNISEQTTKKTKSSTNEKANSRQKQSPQPKEMSKGTPVVLKRGRGRPRKDESERLKEVGKGRSREEPGELDSVVRPVYGHPGTPILEAGPQDKLIIMVEDFYYGTDQTCRPSAAVSERQPSGFKCVHCDKSIVNNVKLMNHTQQHVEISHQNDDIATHTSCQLCFRHFATPYRLQEHVESVHVQLECTTKCKICEWAFESEPVFLQHMKNHHRPGEMPYVCQVCKFRSSFYAEVMDHFRVAHNGTFHLLCPYCLRVFRSGASYQHHYSRHQKKNVFSCDRCRLHFLFAKEREEHKVQDHKTHIKPKQLEGLKPGTRVTIRTYAAPDTRTQLLESLGMPPSPPQVIEVPPGPKATVSPKRSPPESQIKLLTHFQTRSPVLKKHLCVECSFAVPDFANHYPTYVHCSLCRFRTCCSRAYANHMINNHVTRKTTTKYEALYNSYPRESEMRCTKCRYSSTIGDMMANHLTDHAEHLACTFSDETDVMSDDPELTPTSAPTSPLSGSFVPLHLLSGTSQVSVKPLLFTSRPPTPSPSPTSFTITLQGSLASIRDGFREGELEPHKADEPKNGYAETRRKALLETLSRINPGPSAYDPSSTSSLALNKPLTVRQLTIVLYAQCSGLHQAAQRYGALTSDIKAWTQHQDRLRLKKEWRWCTDRIAEWVLTQREQQLPINEDNLLQTAIEALEEAQEMGDFYQWAVEFMLRHNLGLQASLMSPIKHPLPRNIFESTRIFTRFVAKQTRDKGFQQKDIATLDELSVFVDLSLLSEGSSAALQLFEGGNAPIDVVLAGRADGSLLPPMVFLRGKPSDLHKPPDDSVLLETRPEGFTDEHRLQLWLSKVWQKRELAPQERKGLLVMDTHRGHLANGFLTPLGKTSTIPAVIPIGCSSRLQPLEVCVAPVLREFLQTRWRHLVAGGGGVGLSLGSLALKLTDWLGELVTCLRDRPNILARSFKIVCAPPSEDDQGSAADITRLLTEVLFGSLDKKEEVEKKEEEPMVVEAESNEVVKVKPEQKAQSEVTSPQAELQAIRQVFEKDSDLESFHGFEDKEITEYMRTCSSASPCQSL